MTQLVVGADRSALRLWIEHKGEWHSHVTEQPVAQRNDLAAMADWLTQLGLSWPVIERYTLLQVPHSKTTVRVLATSLLTAAWYYDRPFLCLDVASLETISPPFVTHSVPDQASFSFDGVAPIQ